MATYKILDNQGNVLLDNQTQETIDGLLEVNAEGQSSDGFEYYGFDTQLVSDWSSLSDDIKGKYRIIQQIEE